VSAGADAIRLLALRSEHGYTERVDRALPDEPEAVSAAEQRYQTRQAARLKAERERETWRKARSSILLAIESVHVEVDVESELRAMRRACERVDRKLGLWRPH
jgi:hypothetical protein